MTHCCSQCNFSAQFESGLTMHNQMHHALVCREKPRTKSPLLIKHKSNALPRWHVLGNIQHKKEGLKLSTTSSATKLFDRLRAKVCKSRQSLFVHPEEPTLERIELVKQEPHSKDIQCSAKMLNNINCPHESKESYACHLCSFVADRITVLDRHLLNDHQIGLDSLLKLVMAKTKQGLTEGNSNDQTIRKPYYQEEIEENEGTEFVIETTYPRIKVMKHASMNTELKWNEILVAVEQEFEDADGGIGDAEDLVTKISTLNECMCKFVDSSNTLKRVLNAKELDSKHSIRGHRSNVDGTIFDLALGDDGRRTQSDKIDKRSRDKICRSTKTTLASDSYFF